MSPLPTSLPTSAVLSRRTLLTGVGALGAGLAFAGCTTTPQPSGAPSGAGSSVNRTLKAAGGNFGFPSPFAMPHGGVTAMYLLFDTLAWSDKDGLTPWLAESFDSSDDLTTHTVRLRDGVTWSDGKPLTIDDVAFSATYLKANPMAWSIDTKVIQEVVVTGPREARILTQPYANFARNVLAAMPIVPKHVWESVTEPGKKQDDEALIGSGAYRLETSDIGKGSYRFVARDGYFLGAPYVRQIDFVPVSDEMVALRAGELDVASASDNTPADVLDQFRKDKAFGFAEAGGATATALYFNLSQAPFDDPAVRVAIASAVDRAAFVDRVLGGRGVAGNPGFLPPTNPYYVDQSSVLPRDLDRAREQLNGRTFTIPMVVSSTAVRQAELLTSQLAEVGITLEAQALDPTALQARAASGDYQAALLSFGGLHSDPTFVLGFFDGRRPAGRQFTKVHGYNNPAYNDLLDRQSASKEGVRKELVGQMQRIIATDAPIVALYYPNRTSVFRTSVLEEMYYTPGGFAGGNPGVMNKQVLITGATSGTKIRS